jgi:hypothetical protein
MSAQATERHYTTQEVAEMWGVSTATVRRLFEDAPGVLQISFPRVVKGRKHRPHVLLRIPESVVARLHDQQSSGFRLLTQIEAAAGHKIPMYYAEDIRKLGDYPKREFYTAVECHARIVDMRQFVSGEIKPKGPLMVLIAEQHGGLVVRLYEWMANNYEQ